MNVTMWTKIAVSASAALLILYYVIGREVDLSAELVALAALAASPWLPLIIDSMELPGGTKVKLREQVNKQQRQLDVQQDIIAKLVVYSISFFIFDLLSKLYHGNRTGGEYLYRNNESMQRDLRFLRDHGYIEQLHIRELQDGQNLIGLVRLTPVGNFLVELREQLQKKEATKAAQELTG